MANNPGLQKSTGTRTGHGPSAHGVAASLPGTGTAGLPKRILFIPEWIVLAVVAATICVAWWASGLAGAVPWLLLSWAVFYVLRKRFWNHYFEIRSTALVVKKGVSTTEMPLSNIQSISIRSFPEWTIQVAAINPDQVLEVVGRYGGGLGTMDGVQGVANTAMSIARAAGFPPDQQTRDVQHLREQSSGRALVGKDGVTLATLHR